MCAVRRRVLKSLPVGAGHIRPSTFPAYRFILILYSPVVKIAAHGAAPLLLSFLSYLLFFPETTMKILMISNHLGVQSGVQRYVQNLLLHLDTAKYRVTLFVGQCPPDQASTAPALEAHGVEILAVPDNKKDRIRALAAHLRTHKDYDIIHYHTASKIGAPVCGMIRVLCPRAKIVVHSHIVYPPMTLTWRAAHLVYQLFADYFLGCGVAAGRFVFGDHIDAKPNFSVACNASAHLLAFSKLWNAPFCVAASAHVLRTRYQTSSDSAVSFLIPIMAFKIVIIFAPYPAPAAHPLPSRFSFCPSHSKYSAQPLATYLKRGSTHSFFKSTVEA